MIINKALIVVLAMLGIVVIVQQTNLSFKKNEIKNLNAKIAILQNDLTLLNASLTKQNNALKALELKSTLKPLNTQKIEKIFIKDENCNGELNAYKSLFNSAF